MIFFIGVNYSTARSGISFAIFYEHRVLINTSQEAFMTTGTSKGNSTGSTQNPKDTAKETINNVQQNAHETVDKAASSVTNATQSAASKAHETIDKVADKAAQAPDALAETIDEVSDRAHEVVDRASDTLKQKANTAVSQVENIQHEMRDRAYTVKTSAAEQLLTVAQSLRTESTGSQIPQAESLAGSLEKMAQYLEESSFEDLEYDARQTIRQNPWQSVGAALVAGYFLGKIFRR
jgi:ElaB/YqjD/DUF883 family membrane-anchored ribosome-binding protein